MPWRPAPLVPPPQRASRNQPAGRSPQEEIDAFLSEQQDEEEAFEDNVSPAAAAAAAAGPAAKKRRGADGGALLAGGAGAGGAARLPPGNDLAVPLSAKRFACVRRYGGRLMADVREYYEKEGELRVRAMGEWLGGEHAAAGADKALPLPPAPAARPPGPLPPGPLPPARRPQPGSKGMALQAPAWAALAAQMPALTAGLEARDEGVWVDLGGGKRASVSGFKGGLTQSPSEGRVGAWLAWLAGLSRRATAGWRAAARSLACHRTEAARALTRLVNARLAALPRFDATSLARCRRYLATPGPPLLASHQAATAWIYGSTTSGMGRATGW